MTLNTKDKIFLSAKQLIGEKGYTNTKVIDITKNAGISKGSFYTYFKTKEDVLAELLEKMFEEYKETFDKIEYKKDLKIDLEKFVENMYHASFTDQEGIKLITGMFMSTELSERIINIRNLFMKGVEDHLISLFELNKDEIAEESYEKLNFLSPAFEKFIRVYVSGTFMICRGIETFDSKFKKLLPKEIEEHKEFLANSIYKSLKK